MVFKVKKIPKHLIIRDEYELRQRSRFGFFKFVVMVVAVVGLTYVASVGMTQL